MVTHNVPKNKSLVDKQLCKFIKEANPDYGIIIIKTEINYCIGEWRDIKASDAYLDAC